VLQVSDCPLVGDYSAAFRAGLEMLNYSRGH